METLLVKFVKGRKNKLVGCVVAKKQYDKVYVSGSLCRNKKDIFTKNDAVALAEARATMMATDNRACPLPYSLKTEVEQMADRAKRYFKDQQVIMPAIKSPTLIRDENIQRFVKHLFGPIV